MLSARRTAATVAWLALAFVGTSVEPATAAGGPGGGVVCPPKDLNCDVTAQGPGKPADSHPGGGSGPDKPAPGGTGQPTCEVDGKAYPCTSDLGTFNPADGCYWQVLNPQPGPDDPIWTYANLPDGWKPGDKGSLYNVNCPGVGREVLGGTTFSATDPTAGGGVDVQALAQEAVQQLKLLGADIGITPKPDGKSGGLVGLPVWMWNKPAPTRTGPASASASAGGVTVTAIAKVRTVVWDMGDGTRVTCTGPGTPYKASFGKRDSPDCGHYYEKAPRTDEGQYKVTATTTWDIHWAGAGQTGDIETTRQAAVSIRVGELQVLN